MEKNYENAPVFFLDASLLRDPRSIIISCPPHYNSSESDDENALYLFLRYALHGHGGSFCCGKPLSVSYIGSFVMLRENPSPFLARAVFQSSVPLRVELEPEFFLCIVCVCLDAGGGLVCNLKKIPNLNGCMKFCSGPLIVPAKTLKYIYIV